MCIKVYILIPMIIICQQEGVETANLNASIVALSSLYTFHCEYFTLFYMQANFNANYLISPR